MPGPDPRNAVSRLSARIDRVNEANSERMDKLVERIEAHFDRLEAKIDLKVDKLDDDTQREFAETRIAIGELRDVVNIHSQRIEALDNGRSAQMIQAVEGAARGAVQGAANTAPKRFLSTWKGWVITVGAAIAGIAAFVQGLPPIVRFFDGLFGFLGKLK